MKDRPLLMCAEMVQATLRDVDPKTQTRRIGKLQGPHHVGLGVAYHRHATKGLEAVATYDAFPGKGTARWAICSCPYGVPGDRLWVRETFYCDHCEYQGALAGLPSLSDDDKKLYMYYAADGDVRSQIPECEGTPKLKPAIFMPRWASRITLELTAVRVERLQDISEADAKAEGIETKTYGSKPFYCTRDYSYPKHADGFWPGLCIGNGRQYRDSYRTLWEKLNGDGSWDLNPWVWVISFKKV